MDLDRTDTALDQIDTAADTIGAALVGSGLLVDVAEVEGVDLCDQVRDALRRIEPLVVAAVQAEAERLAAEEDELRASLVTGC